MGYYTNFTLTIHEGTADLQVVKNALDSIMEFPGDESLFDIEDLDVHGGITVGTIITGDSVKWYDHDQECSDMSKQFPGVVFKLHGDGEETGDMWDAYYKDGKCQICRATFVFPPYDPTKLKSVQQAQTEDQGRPL
jgi:hypothetical protein